MEKEEVIAIMLNSINSDNKELCQKAGLSKEETESQIAQSQPSLGFILSNAYDKLKDAGAFA